MLTMLLAAALAAPLPESGAQRVVTLLAALVETDTTLATGNCTLAAEKMRTALLAGGFAPADMILFADPTRPKEGGLVAVLNGEDGGGALLLVSHLDTVEADPRDWTHPPFELSEAGGYYHGRGVVDAKGVSALLVDLLIRLREDGARLRRPVKIALTCGEESPQAFNGVAWLARHRRALIDADLALVPTGGAMLDERGVPVSIAVAAGEKSQQVYRIEALGDGAHASRPTLDNAIYDLVEALARLRALTFPVRLVEAARTQLRDESERTPQRQAAERLLQEPADRAAAATVSARPGWNAIIRTTCTPTVIDTGRQPNTIASRASALINCRLLPGDAPAMVEARLRELAGGGVTVTAVPPLAEPAVPPPPLAELGLVAEIARRVWPGVAVRSTLLTGSTDARHLNATGIPAYGLTILFNDPDGNGVHAANERVRVRSVQQGREFLYRIVLAYAGTPE